MSIRSSSLQRKWKTIKIRSFLLLVAKGSQISKLVSIRNSSEVSLRFSGTRKVLAHNMNTKEEISKMKSGHEVEILHSI